MVRFALTATSERDGDLCK